MRAVILDRFGEPAEVLETRDLPTPEPKAGEVRVRMLASPINPSDLMMVRGRYGMLPILPATPGLEGVGVVEKSGGGLYGRFLVGKPFAAVNGATGNWREFAIVPALRAIPVPSSVPDEQAAMFFVNPMTAYAMTRRILQIPQAAWLLQTAAGSALGRMVIRLGKRYGFRTINVVRRNEQADELRALGADAVIATDGGNLVDEVWSLTKGKGVEFALDAVGGAIGAATLASLGETGRMLIYGTLSGEPIQFSPRDLLTKTARVEGFWLPKYMQTLGLLGRLKLVRSVGKLVADGTLAAPVGQTFSLERIKDAVRAAESVARSGKVLLKIADR